MSPTSNDEVRKVAREAARAEVKRLFRKVVYFLAGTGLLTMSATAPAAVTGADGTGEAVVLAALGLLFLVGGVYLLAYVFDLDVRAARWVKRHLPGAR